MRIPALLLLLLIWFAAAGTTALGDEPPAAYGKVDLQVSPLLTRFIEQRQGAESQSRQQPSGVVSSRSQSGDSIDKSASSAEGPASTETADDPVRFDSSGNLQVYIHLDNTDEETLQQLRDLGADIEIVNSDWKKLQAWAPVEALDQIASLDAVQKITPPDYGVTKEGSVTTEGDAIHRADLVRHFSGLAGAGVRVGVISHGVDSWNSARARGDLPSNVQINPNIIRSGDEGTALLEIIHDLAPDAQLAFSSAGSSLYFVEAILWLANDAFGGEGADIIVDDIGYYGESFFEDGPVALAAADAVAGGAVFVSAAGNAAEEHYEADFVDGGGGYHAFDGDSDISLRIRGSFLNRSQGEMRRNMG